MDEPMLDLVLASLERARGTWQAVADGSGVPYHTITRIAQGRIPNPGVKSVQALFDYFKRSGTLASGAPDRAAEATRCG